MARFGNVITKNTYVLKFEESIRTVVKFRGSKIMTKSFGKLWPNRCGVGTVQPAKPVKNLPLKMEGNSVNTVSIQDPVEGKKLLNFVDPSNEIIAFSEMRKFESLLPRRAGRLGARTVRWLKLCQI